MLHRQNPISDKTDLSDPKNLVGKDIWHRFFNCNSKDYLWIKGFVLPMMKKQIKLRLPNEGEEEHCFLIF